ncbi:MAG TPA: hypothetical protein VGU67_01500 [Edaphobacter sp.]|nr:hypothetical protein [Edaphobacter sp.]
MLARMHVLWVGTKKGSGNRARRLERSKKGSSNKARHLDRRRAASSHAAVERPLYFALAVACSSERQTGSFQADPRTSKRPSMILHSTFYRPFSPKMNQKPDKTDKNQKKPVETEEIWLTKRSEKPKVNCGTVLRTRMNIGEYASQPDVFLIRSSGGQGEQTQNFYFERKKKE